MGRYGRPAETGRSVYDEAKWRIGRGLDLADRPVVSFSGGKDSTVLLNLVIEVCRERNRLPVDVFFCDEEIVAPETVAYMRRVAQRTEIRLLWSCVPVRHRNACSHRSPWWVTWDPEIPDKWVRPMPEEGITGEMRPDVPRDSILEQVDKFYPPQLGSVIEFLGRRTGESLTRHKMITQRRGEEAFLSQNAREGSAHRRGADPIYDWTTSDVWGAIHSFGWDYSRAYDLMTAIGFTANVQRLAPPFGEEPLNILHMWRTCWPELWDRMQSRVPGADAASRYARTAVYAIGDHSLIEPAPGETWEELVHRIILRYPAADRAIVAHNMARAIELQVAKARRPLPDSEPDPYTGLSWKKLAVSAWKGMLKVRSAQGKLFSFRGKVNSADA